METYLLVRSEIVGLYFNRLTDDYMYYDLNWEIFPQKFVTE